MLMFEVSLIFFSFWLWSKKNSIKIFSKNLSKWIFWQNFWPSVPFLQNHILNGAILHPLAFPPFSCSFLSALRNTMNHGNGQIYSPCCLCLLNLCHLNFHFPNWRILRFLNHFCKQCPGITLFRVIEDKQFSTVICKKLYNGTSHMFCFFFEKRKQKLNMNF